MNNFIDLINKIHNYSHAYLINTNNLEEAYNLSKKLATLIINENNDGKLYSNEEIERLIDNESFDDFYVVKNDNLLIKVDEINNLMHYFETKSLREDGRRVYIIVGIEKIRPEILNKLLKFIEEPEPNIYGILISSDISKILPTIISRCQKLDCFVENDNTKDITLPKSFLESFMHNGMHTIAFTNSIFNDELTKEDLYSFFEDIELIINNHLHKLNGLDYHEEYILDCLNDVKIEKLINYLDITTHIKNMVKYNLNINLLIDRYIIELDGGIK